LAIFSIKMITKSLNNVKANDNNSSQKKSVKPAFFQPKLTINQPNDVYEQEADHMADKVMRMPDPSINQDTFFKPANTHVQRKCQACEEKDKFVHRKENSTATTAHSNQLSNYISSLSSSGQPMSKESRSFFEPKFGHDFSNVKLHTDGVAAKSAQSINALAYTTGNNIVFNSGQYSPESERGKRLMAHELTHVVQQRVNVQRNLIQRDGGIGALLAGAGGAILEADAVAAPEEIATGPVGWGIGLGALAVGGLLLGAGALLSSDTATARPCPPCPPAPPPEVDLVPPSTPHFPCPGNHWHYYQYNQNPTTCQCFGPRRLFGGCCGIGTPGAPC